MFIQQALLAFIEGVGLILSPCILPILPLVLASSLTGGKRRPIGIIIGFIISFTLFTIAARQLVSQFNIDPMVLQNASLIFLVLFGAVMLFPQLDHIFSGRIQALAAWGDRLTNKLSANNADQENGLRGGIIIGSLISLVWAPCSGPIMAVALVQIIQAKTSLLAMVIVLMFVTGAAVPMFIIAMTGRSLMQKLGFLKNHAVRLRQALGVIILGAAVMLYSGVTEKLLANSGAPIMTQATTQPATPNSPVVLASAPALPAGLQKGLAQPIPAPEFAGISQWFNSQPLTMAGLRGKVVLVDFWTYSCINCVRTLPYVTAWDKAYRDKGLVIIGVHAPEFQFEKKPANVQEAITAHHIEYPVALDNDLATWTAFANRYWPAHYLINQAGEIVYVHFGEGNYDITEHNIRTLLGITPERKADAAPVPAAAPVIPAPVKADAGQSPETYLGYGRAKNFASVGALMRDKATNYDYPATLPLHNWALQGKWQVGAQNITAQQPKASLRYRLQASKVFLVLGSKTGKPIKVKLTLNGQPLGNNAGKDAPNGELTVSSETLYELVNQPTAADAVLELTTEDAGLQAYAFTFG